MNYTFYLYLKKGGVKYTLAATVKLLSEMEAAKGWIT